MCFCDIVFGMLGDCWDFMFFFYLLFFFGFFFLFDFIVGGFFLNEFFGCLWGCFGFEGLEIVFFFFVDFEFLGWFLFFLMIGLLDLLVVGVGVFGGWLCFFVELVVVFMLGILVICFFFIFYWGILKWLWLF